MILLEFVWRGVVQNGGLEALFLFSFRITDPESLTNGIGETNEIRRSYHIDCTNRER